MGMAIEKFLAVSGPVYGCGEDFFIEGITGAL